MSLNNKVLGKNQKIKRYCIDRSEGMLCDCPMLGWSGGAAGQQCQIIYIWPASKYMCTGVLLRIWLKQGKEKRLLARILEILENARKRLSRQNSTKKCVKVVRYSNTCMCLTEILVFSLFHEVGLFQLICPKLNMLLGPHFCRRRSTQGRHSLKIGSRFWQN